MTDQSASPRPDETRPGSGEARVQETGLPHVCQGGTFGDLGDRILIATDLGRTSRKVEARALDLAAQRGSTLLVVAITGAASAGGSRASRRLQELTSKARQRGIDVVTRVESGDPVEIVIRVAEELGASGIIVGDDQWRAALAPRPCICAPLILQGARPLLVVHASATPPCAVVQ
jgi:K+-sensing histidine kinase KdpD